MVDQIGIFVLLHAHHNYDIKVVVHTGVVHTDVLYHTHIDLQ